MVDIGDWDEYNEGAVVDDSSGATGIERTVHVIVTWDNSSLGSGQGDAEFSVTSLSNQSELVVTQGDKSTVRDYEVIVFDDSNKKAILAVHGPWDRDGSNQIVVGCGAGDGTDYSMDGSGANPWENNAWGTVQHKEQTSGDYVGSTSTGMTSNEVNVNSRTASGQYGNAPDIVASNAQYIDWGDKAPVQTSTSVNYHVIEVWVRPEATGDLCVFDKNGAYSLFYDRAGNQEFKYATYGGNIDAGSGFSTNEWHHVVFLYYQNNWVSAWVNGTKELDQASYSDDIDGNNTLLSEGIEFTAQDKSSYRAEFDGQIDHWKMKAGSQSFVNTDWVKAGYDASPKGGQSFFSWSGSQATDTVGSVYETSGSGVKKTTSNGVFKTNASA